MEYYTITDLSRYLHIAPETAFKRYSCGMMPKPDSERQGQRGRPAKLWLKSKAENYKATLINEIINLNKNHSFNRVCETLRIDESQAKKLLNDYKSTNMQSVNGYDLFIKTSARIGA